MVEREAEATVAPLQVAAQRVLSGSRVLVVGCGDVGQRTALLLSACGCEVYGMRRKTDGIVAPIRPLRADVTDPRSLAALTELGRFDYLVFATAAGRSGEEGYRRLYLDGLGNVLHALAGAPPRRILWSSSTSVYHQNDGSSVDERSSVRPASYNGKIMLEAEAALFASGMPATVVRFGGIYGPGRTRLIDRVRAGVIPGAAGNLTNRMHSDDCARTLVHLLALDAMGDALSTCYLAVDSRPSPLGEVCRWLAARVGVDPDSLQEQGTAQRGGNKRCSNQRLLASGFQLRYPDYRAGYGEMLSPR